MTQPLSDGNRRFLIHPSCYYRLAKLYELRGARKNAMGGYERFLTLWKGTDKNRQEVVDAKKRLSRLKALTGG